ncbi:MULTISPECIES: outer membrane protein OmpK [Acinetobacter]|uniref:outer membrane protein OmpK n=1 Tax=Acinetobacter TaxID=469 RepID=UPI00109CE5C3|nr:MULTISPECIES: outer membrane protein OmpK [Acinetobacter]MBT0887196.1 ion channel protein Tsx [Acinetobacter towneri]MDM1486046.1 ion channel protein Tsx [Acinetobacter towneri]MDV2454993.1 outer membrane protein OmpK [Acinetobacter towneri]NWJ92603.1 ion channel protein Tsx [Acinetobacter sp. Swhac1]WOE28916.1 outer membrane protein OmpK [Acinetobacter towneri]
MKFTHIAALCALSTAATFTQAAPVWQDFSITGLYGENYAHPVGMVDDLEQTTITAEYAAGLKYGDFFAFADRTNNDLSGNETYFEVAPRLSLGAVSGQKLAVGPIKDVLIATTWEGGEGFNNYLYGIGFALDIPYTQYANINFYKVENDGQEDDYQMTITYAIPFKLGSEEFLADAFLDWSTAEKNNHASELNWTSQYKWNVGKHISPDTKLYVGIEHSVWNNKYAIKGLDEHNVSALVKYHF